MIVITIKVFHCSSRLYLTQVHAHVGIKSNTKDSIHFKKKIILRLGIKFTSM